MLDMAFERAYTCSRQCFQTRAVEPVERSSLLLLDKDILTIEGTYSSLGVLSVCVINGSKCLVEVAQRLTVGYVCRKSPTARKKPSSVRENVSSGTSGVALASHASCSLR